MHNNDVTYGYMMLRLHTLLSVSSPTHSKLSIPALTKEWLDIVYS